MGNSAGGKLGICDWEVTCLSTGKAPAPKQVTWEVAQVRGSDYAGSLQAVMSSEQQLALIVCLDKILHRTSFFSRNSTDLAMPNTLNFPPHVPHKALYENGMTGGF